MLTAPPNNIVNLLSRLSRSEIPSYRLSSSDAVATTTERSRVSDIKILIEDPCHVAEVSLRNALGTLSAKSTSPTAVEEIRAVLTEFLEPQELEQLRVLVTGNHRLTGGIVVACGRTKVEMSGQGILILVGNAQGVARGSLRVIATDDTQLSCYDDVNVDAGGRVKVQSFDRVVGIAFDKVRGVVRGSSQWTVTGNAIFDSHDNATIFGAGSANIRAYGRSRIRCRGKSKAQLFDTSQGWFVENTEVSVEGGAMCYAQDQVLVLKKTQHSRVQRFIRGQTMEVFSWMDHTDQNGHGLCAVV